MLHICLQFEESEAYCESLIKDLRKFLPEHKISHCPTSGLNGELLGTHSIYLDTKNYCDFYLAFGFLSVFGGHK